MTKSAEQEITQTVRDYFEGWFEGDVDRMDRALHPDLVKRSPRASLVTTTKERMLELTAEGEGAADTGDGRVEISIADVHADIATVTVGGGVYHEYLHLVHTPAGWKIANALWSYR